MIKVIHQNNRFFELGQGLIYCVYSLQNNAYTE